MSLSKASILVVDDETGVLLTMTSILRQEGYHVDGAENGQKAIAAIRQRFYDLVLTDLNMPGIGGMEVLAEVQKRSPNTVTVVITGYGSLDSALQAIRLGAYEYLLKPTEVEELKQAVRRSLDRKRLSELDRLYSLSRVSAASRDFEEIVDEVSKAGRDVLALEQVSLVCFEKGGTPQDDPGLAAAVADDAMQDLLRSGEAVLREHKVRAVEEWARTNGIRDYAFVPGRAAGRLVCVLCAGNGKQPYEFHASAVRFLQALAEQAALAIENITLIGVLQRNNEELAGANRKLRELDQLKSQFLSVATHELRTPLSILLGYNSMLEESLQERLTAEERATLQESNGACKRLIRLVNSMLDISQIESGHMQMDFEVEDLRRVVNGVATLFQQEAVQRGVNLHLEMPTRVPKLKMDGDRMQQVLINLVGNAMKFTPRGGDIRIAVRQRGENLEVSVQDTGIGIAARDHQIIFDEFARVRQQDRKPEGAGLGLAIAKRIVAAHGGDIRVNSEPGTGSIFTVSLPIQARRQSAAPAASA